MLGGQNLASINGLWRVSALAVNRPIVLFVRVICWLYRYLCSQVLFVNGGARLISSGSVNIDTLVFYIPWASSSSSRSHGSYRFRHGSYCSLI
jgi:hypothetical protein